MKRVRGYFNPTIYGKDMLRFWPIWALELVLMLLAYILPFFSEINEAASYAKDYEDKAFVEEVGYIFQEWLRRLANPWLVAVLCIVVVVFLFSYLTQEREAYMIHSFPVNRSTLFASHYLAGLTMLVIPFAIMYLLVMVMAAGSGVGGAAFLLLGCFAELMIEIFLFYHLGCLVVMLTGNGIMAMVVYAVLNFLYTGVAALYYELQEKFVYGFSASMYDGFMQRSLRQVLTPVYSLSALVGYVYDSESGWSWDVFGATACYLVPAVLFLALAMVLYRKRPVEAAGDMVAFSWGRPIFRTVFSVCGGISFALLVYILGFSGIKYYRYNTIFCILLVLVAMGVALFYLVSNMILYRTFRIWKRISFLRMAILVVAVLASMFYVKLGIGRSIPKADNVGMMRIEAFWTGDMMYCGDLMRFYFYDKEEIEEFQKLEQNILREGPNLGSDCDGYVTDVTVTYYLKNGGRMVRMYPMLTEDYPGEGEGTGLYGDVKQFLSSSEDVCQCLFGPDYEEPKVNQVELYHISKDETEDSMWDLDAAGASVLYREEDKEGRIDKLYQAILEDLESGSFSFQAESDDALAAVILMLDEETFFTQQEEGRREQSYLWDVEYWDNTSVELVITGQCTATISALKEIGMEGVLEM